MSYGQKVIVKLHSIEGYGEYEDFARKAAKLLEEVFNSEEFKSRVLKGNFKKTNGLNNARLYDVIMQAREKDGAGGEEGVVDLRVRTLDLNGKDAEWKDNCYGSTIGVDGGGSGISAICPNKLEKWVKEEQVSQLAGHYAHEYIHQLGFNHYRSWWDLTNSEKKKTFVYQIGDLVEKLANK
jgi:hypothetical protein